VDNDLGDVAITNEMVFDDLSLIEVSVRIKDVQYVLREGTAEAVRQYRNSIVRSTKLGVDGRPTSIDGIADCDLLIVSLCLFEHYKKGDKDYERPVPLAALRLWPDRVVKNLCERAKLITGIKEQDDSEETLVSRIERDQRRLELLRAGKSPAKNGQEGGTSGSE